MSTPSTPSTSTAAPRRSLARRLLSGLFRRVNRKVAWHRLPRWVGLLNLLAYRNDLRDFNLVDTAGPCPHDQANGELSESDRMYRHPTGRCNDLSDHRMGSANTRFGRNVELAKAVPTKPEELLSPSPRLVSQRLMTRDRFRPATSLNVLAAAWIQFQNHDWFNHGQGLEDEHLSIVLDDADDWHERPMRVRRSNPDTTRVDGDGDHATHMNTETHWWDGSQIYGSSRERQELLRTFEGGRLKIEDDGLLPLDPNSVERPGIDLTGFSDNWWVGMSLLHTLFAREHNAVAEALEREYPGWSDERLFQTARLVVAALTAKIHTVEWTPGILAHPVLQTAMSANWWGLLGERFKRRFGRLGDSELLSGIVGSSPDHHAAPYYLTEEFVSVYRLHPLIPDEFEVRSIGDDRQTGTEDLVGFQGKFTRGVVDRYGFVDLLYSLGTSHPGAITLHNYPRGLQNFERISGEKLDLAAVDILRDRERCVPRYNDFRECLRMPRVKSFETMTDDPVWAEELADVYGDPDRVDLMSGLYAEPLPKGFGFSDTAFRIFILMASRRLKSDRFFTTDYRPEVYSPLGLRWIDENDMRTVIARHVPELADTMAGMSNAFAPWPRTGAAGTSGGR